MHFSSKDEEGLSTTRVANVAASFQRAATTHLEDRLRMALELCKQERHIPLASLVVSGGVASNQYIRDRYFLEPMISILSC